MKFHRGLMSISDFAAFCGSTRQTLQYYDRIGLLDPIHVESQGYRYYHPLQGHEFRLINSLRRSGCSLDEVEEILNSTDIDVLQNRIEEKQRALELEMQRIRREQRYLRRFYVFLCWSSRFPPNEPVLYHSVNYVNLDEVVQVERCEPYTTRYYEMLMEYAEYCKRNHTVQLYPYVLYVDPEELAGEVRFSGVYAFPDNQYPDAVHSYTAVPGSYLCMRSYPDQSMDIRKSSYAELHRYMREHGLRPLGGAFEIPFCIPRGLRRKNHFTVVFIIPVAEEAGTGGEEA